MGNGPLVVIGLIGVREINNFFSVDNIEKVNSFISIAKEKEINGVPFLEVGNDVISGAQSTTNLEAIIKSNLS